MSHKVFHTSDNLTVAGNRVFAGNVATIPQILKRRGITNIRSIEFKRREGFERIGTQTYKSEERPSGRWLGDYTTAAEAWAADRDGIPSAAGDYYWSISGAVQAVLTTQDAATAGKRFGTDHLPDDAMFVTCGTAPTGRLLIFDMTHPEMPLWMQFDSIAYTMLGQSNTPTFNQMYLRWDGHILWLAKTGGNGNVLMEIDFLNDVAFYHGAGSSAVFASGIAKRNDAESIRLLGSVSLVPSTTIRGMDAIDNYAFVATDAGFGVIKPDNAAVHSATTGDTKDVAVLNGRLFGLRDTSPEKVWDMGPYNALEDDFAPLLEFDNASTPILSYSSMTQVVALKQSLLLLSVSGFDQLWVNPEDKEASLLSRHGINYATPPMKNPTLMVICETTTGDIGGGSEYTAENALTEANSLTGITEAAATASIETTDTDGQTYAVAAAATGGGGRIAIRLDGTSGTVAWGKHNTVEVWAKGSVGDGSLRIGTADEWQTTNVITLQGVNADDTWKKYTLSFTAPEEGPLYLLFVEGVGANNSEIILNRLRVYESIPNRDGNGGAGEVLGSLTRVANTLGAVAGIEGFDTVDDLIQVTNPLAGVTTEDFFIFGAFECAPTDDAQMLFEISHYESMAYTDTVVQCFLHGSDGYFRFRVSINGLVSIVTAESTSVYDDGLLHTWTARKKDGKYELHIDKELVASVSVGSHGTLSFDADALARIGRSGSGLTFAPDATIYLTSTGIGTLYDIEVPIIHTYLRALIEGKVELDEIPTMAAYDPVRDAVELVGTTYRQTLKNGTITESAEHGQGSSATIAVGPRSAIGVGGATSVEANVPERNLRTKELTLVTERFTINYVADGTEVMFPNPYVDADIAKTIGAYPVQVVDAGEIIPEDVAGWETVDYGLGRKVPKFAVAPTNTNIVSVTFEREVYK